jgi:Carboxypeptidase regulatory-like domain
VQFFLQRAAWALLFSTLVLPSSAQIQNGQFTGIITDPSDAVVANASVKVTNTRTGYSVVVYSNEAGLWSAQELLVGEYRITVEAPGFRTATSDEVNLSAGSIVRLNFKFIRGPGRGFIDSITTGVGQIKNASTPCPGNPLATVAGPCGPGGFAPAKTLGAGDHNNFGPRVGFAWDMFGNGKTSLRAGFGIAYEGTLFNPLSNTRWNPPYYSLDQVFNYLAGDVNDVVYGPVDGGIPTFLGAAPRDSIPVMGHKQREIFRVGIQ